MTDLGLNNTLMSSSPSLGKSSIDINISNQITDIISESSDLFIELLCGNEIKRDLSIPSKEQIEEAFSSADVSLPIFSYLYAFERVGIELLQGIFREEHTPIFLADGTKLGRAEAERKLAQKEVKRAFVPLRDAMENAAKRTWPPIEIALQKFQAFQDEFGLSDADSRIQQNIDALLAYLRNTQDLAEECMGILLGPHADGWQTEEEFARLLDPVDEDGGFSDAAARALSMRMRDAAEKRVCRPLVRIRAPDAMVGHVISVVSGAVRVMHADARRGHKFGQLVTGGATGVIASLFPQHAISASLDLGLRTLGHAFSYGGHLPLVRKSVLGESAQTARHNGQRAMALWFLNYRCDAVLTVSRLQSKQNPDVDGSELLRENVLHAFGANCDPAARFWQQKRLPPWPGTWGAVGSADAKLNSLIQQGQAAALFMRLRDRFDEIFPLMSSPYEQIADAGNALSEGVCSVADLYDIAPEEDGTVSLISEFLSL